MQKETFYDEVLGEVEIENIVADLVEPTQTTPIADRVERVNDVIAVGSDPFIEIYSEESKMHGHLKSTKVCNVPNGCVMQVTTALRGVDGSYSVSDALTYIPGLNIDKETKKFKGI